MYFVVFAFLSLLLTIKRPIWSRVHDPALVLALVSAATLVPPLVALFVTRRSLQLLDRTPHDPHYAQYCLGRGTTILHALIGGGHCAILAFTDWITLLDKARLLNSVPALPSLAATIPFILTCLLTWTALYPIDRAIRQIALEIQLFRGQPVRAVWSLGAYLAFNLRHQLLFILAPMVLILIARDVLELYDTRLQRYFRYEHTPEIVLGAATAVVAIITPAILRRIWITQRLPEGPLRDRLILLCRKLRLRCREILVWRSGGMLVNAAVMGVVPPIRYVLITDAMLEQMDDTRIEAVFGHEAGHVKRHHITYFMLFALISGCLLTVVSVQQRSLSPKAFDTLLWFTGAALAAKWALVFGWISRHFERQADIFGVRTLALAGVPCEVECGLHGCGTASLATASSLAADFCPAPAATGTALAAAPKVAKVKENPLRSDNLCAAAAMIFGETLNEVAQLNGIPAETRSWRHSSIASRARFVEKLASDPRATARFERRVGRIKLGILVAAAGSALWAAWAMRLWEALRVPFGI
ncbi:MAG: M48 family metalloprotease [Phycisphaerales bacterium]|nr:M48 family metalloprotease [Phycisphaerales bacterium]